MLEENTEVNMKKISVLIPCYNERGKCGANQSGCDRKLWADLPRYDYELVFIDNDSRDNTRPILRRLCQENPKIKAIFNAEISDSLILPTMVCCR